MFYILYLSSLCKRRRWLDPHYECFPYETGFACKVRVNYRDYRAEDVHATEVLAREAAAMRAYLICRNLSVNESLYPGSGGLVLPAGGGNPIPASTAVTQASSSAASAAMAVGRAYGMSGHHHQGGNLTPMMAGGTQVHSQHGVHHPGRLGHQQGMIVVGHSQMGV